MSEVENEQAERGKPAPHPQPKPDPSLPPTPKLDPSKGDVYVHSYVRYVNGKRVNVRDYFRRAEEDTTPLDDESRKKLVDLLHAEQRENEAKITRDTNAFNDAKNNGDTATEERAKADLQIDMWARDHISARLAYVNRK